MQPYKVLKPYHFEWREESCIGNHTNIIKTSPYGLNEPAPKQSLDYSFPISISGLLIRCFGF